MIFVVPYVLRREKQRTAAVMIIDADSYTAAEQRVAAAYGNASRVGDAIELDLAAGAQRVEIANWDEA